LCRTLPDFNWHARVARSLSDSWVSCLGLLPRQNFAQCKIHFTSDSCICLYWQHYCMALQQRASSKLCGGVVQGMELRNFRKGRHLYSAGRPSRWALAHILAFFDSRCTLCSGNCSTFVFEHILTTTGLIFFTFSLNFFHNIMLKIFQHNITKKN